MPPRLCTRPQARLLLLVCASCPLLHFLQRARTTRRPCSPASSSSAARSSPARCGVGAWVGGSLTGIGGGVAGSCHTFCLLQTSVDARRPARCSGRCLYTGGLMPVPCIDISTPSPPPHTHTLTDGGHGERPAAGQGAREAVRRCAPPPCWPLAALRVPTAVCAGAAIRVRPAPICNVH